MTVMNNLKLVVDVVSAYNLKAKDGKESCSAYVELYFDGQRYRTTVKDKDLCPVWGESFFFSISDPLILQHLNLEACVYSTIRGGNGRSLLGKVSISGTSFAPQSDAVLLQYPLKKGRIFSSVRGELRLMVYVADDCSVNSSPLFPSADNSPILMHAEVHPAATQVSQIKSEEMRAEAMKAETPPPKIGGMHSTSVAQPVDIALKETCPFSPRWCTQPSIPPKAYVADDPSVNSSPLFPSVDNSANLMHAEVHPATTQVSQIKSEETRAEAMKAETETSPAEIFRMYFVQPVDIALEETGYLRGGTVAGCHIPPPDKRASTNDSVEMDFFSYVRIVKARDLPIVDISGGLDLFVEVKVGSYKGVTKHIDRDQDPEWQVVFAFSKGFASLLSVAVRYKHLDKDDSVGIVRFDLNEVPRRVPRDSPLSPRWYGLEDNTGKRVEGELMLAVWTGTQADEVYHSAWRVDAAMPAIDLSDAACTQLCPKVYDLPKLWYIHVTVIEAQDLEPTDRTCFPEVYIKGQVGDQVVRTRTLQSRTLNPRWNEDLFFVVAEPFEDDLVLTVMNNVSPGKDEILGRLIIPPSLVGKRLDHRPIHSRWYKLEKPIATDADQLNNQKFSSRLHLRVCLDGGYHVLDESTRYSSDLRPTAKQLWKAPIGVLEIGILEAEQLHPMKTRDGRETSDTYCIAKYGKKWVRTRTIVDSLFPQYKEQYTWDVFDRATVLTVGVFDNGQFGAKESNGNKDPRIGKVEIRLSALEINRIHNHVYPLLDLRPTGVKTMGRLHLTVRFSCISFAKMLSQYTLPLLPKMHYVGPISSQQQETLRNHAVTIVAMQLGRAEPALHKEVVEYMCEARSHLWSMRRSKANFSRLEFVFSGLLARWRWFGDVCWWKMPITTILVHIVFLVLVCFPALILPMLFLYMFLIVVRNYRYRPRHPPHKGIAISHAEKCSLDELDEEFDTFPTSRGQELVRMRYDRLRNESGRLQNVAGDIATQGERFLALLTWQDRCATVIFAIFCLMAAFVLYLTPFKVVVAMSGLYTMRHPRYRSRLPALPINFLSRLPDRQDAML